MQILMHFLPLSSGGSHQLCVGQKQPKLPPFLKRRLKKVRKEEIPLAVKLKRKHTAASSSAKQRTRQSARQSVPVTKATDSKIDLCSLNEEAEAPSKDMRSTSICEDDLPNSDSIAGNHSPVKCMPENLDSSIDSLDETLQKPLSEASLAYARTINSSTQDDELAEAQFLDDKKAKVISLRKDYNEKKEKVTLLQTELDSNLLTVKEIDYQIAKLNSQQVELMKTVATKKMTMANLTNDYQKVARAIQKVVHQVQVANSKKAH